MAAQKESNEILEKVLLSPYSYFLQVKGKQHRNKIVFAFNYWLQVPTEKVTQQLDIVNMLYASCLLCDDIQDDTKIRGVLPAAHYVYGVPLTINASFHVLLLALEKAFNLCPESCKVIFEEYLEVYRGQGTEIYWRNNLICPTEEQYRKVVEQKTGRFFLMAIRLIQLHSENKIDYSKLIFIIGIYFQIKDDYCNLKYQEGLEGWPGEEDTKVCDNKNNRFCEDITEGKFTVPIIHAMQTAEREQVLNIFRQRTHDVNLKKYCVSLLEKAGSLQHTRDVMIQLDREARAEVANFGGNPELEAVLDNLFNWPM